MLNQVKGYEQKNEPFNLFRIAIRESPVEIIQAFIGAISTNQRQQSFFSW